MGRGFAGVFTNKESKTVFSFVFTACANWEVFLFLTSPCSVFSPPKKPHLQLFQDIQQKNQAVEKSHQIGFFYVWPVCMFMTVVSWKPRWAREEPSSATLWFISVLLTHCSSVSSTTRLQGKGRPPHCGHFHMYLCFFFYVVTSFFHLNMLSVPESVTPEEVWILPSRFKLYFCFSIKMKQPESSQIHPHLKLASSNFQEWSVQKWSETRMLKRVPTNSRQSWMVLFHFVPKTQQSICSIDKTLFRNPFELFLELKEVCSVAQCR